jgi:predicted porin
MKKNLLAAAIAAATLPAAYAVDMKAGDWTVSVGGNINAFYASSECKQAPGTVTGFAIGDASLACGGKSKSTVVGNGLLPSMLNVGAKTTQDGYDVSALIGIGVATATNSSVGSNSAVDVRNAFLTFGNKDMGTFKFGRDYGLFGLNAVLSDMTLLGVGAATQAVQNGRVSLGHLASGYTYAGTYGQLAYSTPSMGGFSVDAGVFNPVDATATASTSPAFQVRASYTGNGFKAWVANKSQEFANFNAATGAVTPGSVFNMNAQEIGGSFNIGAFGLVANYQSGNGVGMLADGDQGDIKGKNTFVQATFQVTDRVKLGVGVGRSENDTAPAGSAATYIRSNENTTAAVYFNLTKSLTLVGEVGAVTSKAFGGAEAKQNSVSFGGIFFF